jgi:BlaI family transcriptional regulator, penicillinase repressor
MGHSTEPSPDPDHDLRHDPAELGELERGILSIIWRMGAVTAEQVREALARPLKDSTVRTVLRRLEEKGYLQHSIENRTFLYRPSESRQRVAGRAVKRIVDWFCEGSVEALLVGMVDSEVLDRSELQRLAERIAAAQKNSAADRPAGTRIQPPVHANGIAHRKKEVRS